MLTDEQIEARAERAKELFMQGFNCSQSVLAACCDLYGLDEQMALRVSASFGGGIARMRHVCGAASGMFMLAGLEKGSVTGSAEEKKANYAFVRELADDFRNLHGSIICADLMGITAASGNSGNSGDSGNSGKPEDSGKPGDSGLSSLYDPTPAPRTEEYYHKRPCGDIIASAVRLYLKRLRDIQV